MLGVAASERRLRPRGGAAGPDPQGWHPPRRGGRTQTRGEAVSLVAHTPAPFVHGLPPPSGARPRSSSCPQACAPQTARCPRACPGISASPPGGGWALTHCGVCPSPRLLRAPPSPPALPQPPSSVPPARGGCGPAPRLVPCRRSIETYRARDGRQFQAIGNLAGKPGT